MNAKSERAIIVLGFAVGGWMLWLLLFSSHEVVPVDNEQRTVQSERVYPQMVDRSLSKKEEQKNAQERVVAKIPKGAKQGERIYRFKTKEALDVYLEEAKKRGIPILGLLDALNVVRVGDSDYIPEGADQFFNYPISLPILPPSNEKLAVEGVSEMDALTSLGFDQIDPLWGSGVKIAVLDTGVSEHPSLLNADLSEKSIKDITLGNGTDDNGHGTAVISLIVGDDAYVQGLAPSSEILSYKVLDEYGRGDTFSLYAAIMDAVASGADIINVSAGSSSYDALLEEAVLYAQKEGVVIVAAGGNQGTTEKQYPAAYDWVISVGAVDGSGMRLAYSNEGIDIMAPSHLNSAWIDDYYITFDGTSGTAGVVSSIIAEVKSLNPLMSMTEVVQVVMETASESGEPGYDSLYGYGVIDPVTLFRINDTRFTDVSAAVPYVMPKVGSNGEAEVVFSIQNKGNKYIPRAYFDIDVNGKKYTSEVMGLNKGDRRSVSLFIPLTNITAENPTTIFVQSRLDRSIEDMNPRNNQKKIRLEPIQ